MSVVLSYSKIALYLQCARAFHDQYISKEWDYQADANSPALIKGNLMHESLEQYIKSIQNNVDPRPLVKGADNAKNIVHKILDRYPEVEAERQLSLDIDWNEVKCNDWWQPLDSSKEVYLRAKFDVIAVDGDTAALIDWKSGKFRPYEESEHGQLKLSAAMMFSAMPEINQINSSYMFLEHKKTSTVTYYREELEDIKKPFDRVAKEINEATHFDEKVNQNCRWCKSLSCPLRK